MASSRSLTMKLMRLLWVVPLLSPIAPCPVAWADPVAPAPAVAEAPAWESVRKLWYILEVNGQRAGWMSQTVESDGERYRTSDETQMSMGRGGAGTVEVNIKSGFVETKDGLPISMHVVQDMATQRMDSEYRFEADGVVQVQRQGERVIESRHPLPEGSWLTPQAAERFWRERLAAGAAVIELRTLAPEQGVKPVTVRGERTGDGTATVDGREIPVSIWKTTTSMLPIAAIEQYSSDGLRVYQEINVGMKMVFRLSDEEQATQAAPGRPPDLMMPTFVKPSRPIEQVMTARRAVYRLRLKDGEPIDVVAAGVQQVESLEDGKVARVTVDLDAPIVEVEPPGPGCLEPSVLVDGDDGLVKKLAERAVKEAGDDPAARAEAMRRFVSRYISQKGLDTAFASASETAKMRTGDCSEHAVLLCAMLRSQGIPARVATGLLYVDSFAGQKDSFGWHMWTQASLDGRWVDLDATLPRAYHAGHILVAALDLSEGPLSGELGGLLTFVGNLDIEVVEVEYGSDDRGK